MEKRKPLIVLLGPTASRKSEVASSLAKEVNGEIISADSMQVYKYLNIGTAKPSRKIRRIIRHHLIDIKYPDEEFSAGEFQLRAIRTIDRVFKKGNLPILVGGTALYIRTMTDGICPIPSRNDSIREHLSRLAEKYGRSYLYKRLERTDKSAAETIHPNNVSRIIRALEVYSLTKILFSAWQNRRYHLPYPIIIFGLHWERSLLYERIGRRVDEMVREGLIKEVERLLRKGYPKRLKSLQGLGYRQVVDFLQGKYGMERMKYLIKRDTRHYAKRQLTWWRKDGRIHWIKMDKGKKPEEVAQEIKSICEKSQFLVQ
jgi:tRNA dimethylallyltransferase